MKSRSQSAYSEFGRRLKIYRIENQITIQMVIDQLRSERDNPLLSIFDFLSTETPQKETVYYASNISDYENGKRKIPTDFIISLARIGWDVHRLFKELKVFPPFDYYTLGVEMKRLGIRVENFPNPFESGYGE